MKHTWTALLAAGTLSTFMALAAEQPASPPANDGSGARGFRAAGRANLLARRGGDLMGLDEQQRELFQDALQKENARLRSLEEKLQTAQKELLEATLASDYDEKTVRAKAEAVAAIQVEMTTLRAKALAIVVPTLKPEQKQQMLESPFTLMLLNSAGWGGRPLPFVGGRPGGPRDPFQGGAPDGFRGGRDERPRDR